MLEGPLGRDRLAVDRDTIFLVKRSISALSYISNQVENHRTTKVGYTPSSDAEQISVTGKWRAQHICDFDDAKRIMFNHNKRCAKGIY